MFDIFFGGLKIAPLYSSSSLYYTQANHSLILLYIVIPNYHVFVSIKLLILIMYVVIEVVLVTLLLTLSRFYTVFCYFCCFIADFAQLNAGWSQSP